MVQGKTPLQERRPKSILRIHVKKKRWAWWFIFWDFSDGKGEVDTGKSLEAPRQAGLGFLMIV